MKKKVNLFQALRAVSHKYPVIMFSCWENVFTLVDGFLRVATPDVNTRPPWKAHVGNTMGLFGEKVITAAIKVWFYFTFLFCYSHREK